MRSLGVCGFVAAVVVLTLNLGPLAVVAQDKKDTKKPEPAAAGVIEIKEGNDAKFRFFVRDGEGKLLAMSGPTGFASAKDAETAIDHLKTVVAKAKVHVLKTEEKKDK
jgi:hypothetical protein